MQNKIDALDDDKIWVISFRKLEFLNDCVQESIDVGNSFASQTVRRVQSGGIPVQREQSGDTLTPVQQISLKPSVKQDRADNSTPNVQHFQDGKPLEHDMQRVARPNTEDSHRPWLVCFSAFFAMVICGFANAFGTLFIDIMEEFQTTRASAAVIQSLLQGVLLGTGVLCGTMVARFGPRNIGLAGGIIVPTGLILSYFANEILMLDLTIGVLAGFGISCIYVSNNTAIAMNFNRSSKVLALSLACSGPGVGGLAFPFLLRYLREKYGLQETFLIVSGLALNTIPCAMLWGAPTKKDHMNADAANKTRKVSQMQPESFEQKPHKSLHLFLSLLKNVPYMLFVLGITCTFAPLMMFTVLVADIYDQKSFGTADSTLGISIIHICGFFGRLLPGIFEQIPNFSGLCTPIVFSALSAILMMSVNFTESLAVTHMVSGMLGCFLGVVITTRTVTLVSLVGPHLFSSAVGLMFTMNGVTSLAIGPLGGLVKDVTQSYELVLYGSTLLAVCGCASCCLAFWIRRRKCQHKVQGLQ